ncbi:MAG TPA: efflux RND transporter periplasmic adaptor subunit [Candidatus Limnocylindria bacterium]|nr:efflux RND transporter periplasmic adaptor subunit [Candidatus Limnocylindria bacterium]
MTSPKKKSKSWLIWVIVAGVLLAAAGGVTGWQKFRPKPLTVQTEKVARRNLTEVVTATGKVQPFLQVKISPEVAGEIIELPVKEGQMVKKGDLLVKIKEDAYIASRDSAQANYLSSESAQATAVAQAAKAEAEFKRNKELFERKLVSESVYDEFRTAFDVAKAQVDSALHQAEMAKQSLKKTQEDLLKCTIYSPIDGTVSKLSSEKGERVVGTGMMAGTEIMTIADLNEMEARVEVGEVDVVLVQMDQRARLEVDSFRDHKFAGVVTQIANSAKTTAANTQSEATKFEVRIRITDKDRFLPGMSVTAEIETRYRTNVLTVPIQAVTTRLPKGVKKEVKGPSMAKGEDKDLEQELADLTKKKDKSGPKPIDVVFTIVDGKAKMLPVKRGISDESYYEILEGVTEGQEIVTGSYKAIARELEDDKIAKVDNTKKDAKPEEKK